MVISFQHVDSFRTKIVESFIESIKVFFVIKPLQKLFYNEGFYEQKLIAMRNLPPNTVGNDLAKILDANELQLIPKYEAHDLKHLILGYEMTTRDEIRMQAYLFGNGNYRLSCILFLSSGILLPSRWEDFYSEYKKGKNAPSIINLSFDECIEKRTQDLRKKYVVSL